MTKTPVERGIWAALAGLIALILVVGVLSLGRGDGAGDELAVIATVPDFSLVDSNEDPVSRSVLDGELWVADFIFTNCAGVCPMLSARMADLQRVLDERNLAAQLVSISVDPARDTPEALRRYAKRFAANPQRWRFLTGDRDALYELIGNGFLLSVSERSPEDAGADINDLITHSDRFVLVDRESRIRGYYHGTEKAAVAKLIEDLEKLSGS